MRAGQPTARLSLSSGGIGVAAKTIDITGEPFGKLTAIKMLDRRDSSRSSIWLCRCECGNTTEVSLSNLRSGGTTSCGCVRLAVLAAASKSKAAKSTCIWCGKPCRGEYCRPQHRKSHERSKVVHECPVCGTAFRQEIVPGTARDRLYCSAKCEGIAGDRRTKMKKGMVSIAKVKARMTDE